MVYLETFFAVVLLGVICVLYRRGRRLDEQVRRLRLMVDHQGGYIFLINKDLVVEETNYYAMNLGWNPKEQPKVLGNVLHCKNGCDAGTCGLSEACGNCPVRYTIKKAFTTKSDFKDVKACMEIYITDKHVTDVNVVLDGRFAYIGEKPYMVIDVRLAS